MDGELLRVDTASSTLPLSPSGSFLADDAASTCPLLTPSPPTNDLINPQQEPEESPKFTIGDELASKLQQVKGEVEWKLFYTNLSHLHVFFFQDKDKEEGDSASSSSSALAEPVCSQLLNHRLYHHIVKDEDISTQVNKFVFEKIV